MVHVKLHNFTLHFKCALVQYPPRSSLREQSFYLSPSRNMPGSYIKLSHDGWLPDNLKFTVQSSSSYWTLIYSLNY
jgi:hypothetical protein